MSRFRNKHVEIRRGILEMHRFARGKPPVTGHKRERSAAICRNSRIGTESSCPEWGTGGQRETLTIEVVRSRTTHESKHWM
ncbi:MAG: hypothetical protein ABGZ17_19620 [Planctomycetaceae bacterium]